MGRLIVLGLCLFSISIVSCSPSENSIHTAKAQTQAAYQTNTATPIDTLEPTPTKTYTPTPTNTPSTTPTPINTPTQTYTPSPTPTLIGGSGLFIFNGSGGHRVNNEWRPAGIVMIDLETMDQILIGERTYELEDISPNGEYILASTGNTLFTMDWNGDIQSTLSDNLLAPYETDAYWFSEDQIIFIGKEDGQSYVYIINADGTGLQRITEPGKKPFNLFPSYDGVHVYWEEGYEINTGSYHLDKWRSKIDGSEHIKIDFEPIFSPTGKNVAYFLYPNLNVPGGVSQKDILHITNIDGSNDIEVIELMEKEYWSDDGLFWSSDGEMFLLQVHSCNHICDKYNHYLISADGKIKSELPEEIGRIFFSGDWSPDSQLFLYERYVKQESGFDSELVLLNTNSMEIEVLEIEDWYSLCGKIKWIP